MQTTTRPVGSLLRQWRERRRLSQLDLAISAEISARHLSFIETGRSNPSRDMVLRLGEHLEVPLRERNQLLLAAGYAPAYRESGLDDPDLTVAREAVRRVLTGHEPYPAVVVDRYWNLVDGNESVAVLTEGVAPSLLRAPANVLRIALHPDGMAPRIRNLGEWRADLLGRLRRQVEVTADPALAELLAELRDYPGGEQEPAPGGIFVPLRLEHRGAELSFFSTIATFGAPVEITLAELAIESFYPADPETGEHLRRLR
ncbi:transcriptional regulator with XRE-family HTH domain [Amycolatopsis bartoniae]|uniref:Transcriptional regulator n=1 Tax=Amycolatopsis bartoniae TaxID=941986 RepID=A0A8H9ITL3_9PSEU|nr:helix-turn-helix transcriptional regulator [Amycolatopsis bartoniae]MBB2936918.1 transcriptional regulator with XRE-family HTH domain [Amycolatopsis bartoniae]TVT01708.1 helix-turn-helix transcriptional regulator [Amycolatopsis bartoniae]GHF51179.1 transcriptional regulator [Amycolatopsis bartoniae]